MRTQICVETLHASVHSLIKHGLRDGNLHDAVSEARLGDGLVYEFCTVLEERVIGYIAACPMTLEAAHADGVGEGVPSTLGLVPLVVAPEYHGQGLGSALVQHLINTAANDGWEAIFVLGKPGFYERLGFTTSHIGNGFGAVRSFQHLELRPGCLRNIDARALYPAPFPNQRSPQTADPLLGPAANNLYAR